MNTKPNKDIHTCRYSYLRLRSTATHVCDSFQALKEEQRSFTDFEDEDDDDEDECEGTVDDVLNARAQNYGKFIEGAEIMQMTKRLVHNYIEQRGTSLAFDQLEAIDMIIHKLGRIINGNPDHLDNWVDIAGYSTLVADRLKGNTR